MLYTIGEKELDFNVKLGVTKKIKETFKGDSFNSVLKKLDKMDIPELIKLLYCGLDEEQLSYSEFKDLCYDNMGMGDLYDLVQLFIKKIQYPGLTEEEIDKKLAEKKSQAQMMGETS